MSFKIIDAHELKKILPMKDAISAMQQAFVQLKNRQVEMPLRTALNIKEQDAIMLSMPAYLPELHQLGLKIVNIFPKNTNQNLAAIHGVVILFDAKTGEPSAILDGAMLTAIRTGAVSGLATDLLARVDAQTLAILGAGVQAKTQLEAVLCVRNIKQIWIYSKTRQNAEQFAQVIANEMQTNARVNVSASAHDAVEHADIVCTATPSTIPLIDLQDVKKGVHINAVGSHTANMKELGSKLMSSATVVVDQRSAALAEAGEVIDAVQKKLLREETLIELGELILQPNLRRTNSQQITIFKSVGLAVQDICAAAVALKNVNVV